MSMLSSGRFDHLAMRNVASSFYSQAHLAFESLYTSAVPNRYIGLGDALTDTSLEQTEPAVAAVE